MAVKWTNDHLREVLCFFLGRPEQIFVHPTHRESTADQSNKPTKVQHIRAITEKNSKAVSLEPLQSFQAVEQIRPSLFPRFSSLFSFPPSFLLPSFFFYCSVTLGRDLESYLVKFQLFQIWVVVDFLSLIKWHAAIDAMEDMLRKLSWNQGIKALNGSKGVWVLLANRNSLGHF